MLPAHLPCSPCHNIFYVESMATSTVPPLDAVALPSTTGRLLQQANSTPLLLSLPCPMAGLWHPMAFLIRNKIAIPGTSLSTPTNCYIESTATSTMLWWILHEALRHGTRYQSLHLP